LEDVGLDRKIILEWIFGKCDGGYMYWIGLAQGDKWQAVLKAVMNLQVQ
jgi:hypothetical protein